MKIENINGWGWGYLSMFVLLLAVTAFNHGKSKAQQKYNFFESFFFIFITLVIQTMAGFYD